MITAEKNRRRGKTNSVQVDINEHIEWLEKRLKEIERGSAPNLLRHAQVSFESQIQSAIAVNPDWQQKMDLLTSVPGIDERPRVADRRKGTRELGR